MKEYLNISKAVADETRARIIMLLRHRELCVCQIMDVLGLAPSTVSKHMAILAQAGLVEFRKDGRWRHYRLLKDASPAARQALNWVTASLKSAVTVSQDDERLQDTLSKEVETLCARYKC